MYLYTCGCIFENLGIVTTLWTIGRLSLITQTPNWMEYIATTINQVVPLAPRILIDWFIFVKNTAGLTASATDGQMYFCKLHCFMA